MERMQCKKEGKKDFFFIPFIPNLYESDKRIRLIHDLWEGILWGRRAHSPLLIRTTLISLFTVLTEIRVYS